MGEHEGERLEHLFAAGRIGTLEVRNRILLCPMGDNQANGDGTVSDHQLDYYEARARGGAGLLLVGSVGVAHPEGIAGPNQLGAGNDGARQGLEALAERVHRHGAAIAAQLSHMGPNALWDAASGRPRLVPSPPDAGRSDRLSRMVTPAEREAMIAPFTRPDATFDTRVATDEDLERVVVQFADAAVRVAEAGFDGIELHAGHGYLLDAFLSPATNHREDEWGGSPVARARLLLEVIAAVRRRVGADFPLWIRLNAAEPHKAGGTEPEQAVATARLAVEAGIDALHVTAYADPNVAIGITDGHTPHRRGALLPLATALRKAVAVPIIGFGRLDPVDADAAIAAGRLDFVAMGRKLLADPELPRKEAEGHAADVRPCIYQYRCIGNIFLNRPMTCVVNPDTTREGELHIGPARTSRRVLVVGGGPAGMEAAHRLADRGHQVTLVESAPQLGGRLRLAAWADEDVRPLLGWLERQLARTGVTVETGVDGTPALAESLGADEVVVATGGRWTTDVHAGAASTLLVPLDDVTSLVGETPAGRVAVLGSSVAALAVARRLAAAGWAVTMFADGPVIAPELGLPGRFRLVHELGEAGGRVEASARVIEVDDDGVWWRSADGAGVPDHLIVDCVVSVPTPQTDRRVADRFEAAGRSVHVIGDACSGDRLESALLDAARVAVAIA